MTQILTAKNSPKMYKKYPHKDMLTNVPAALFIIAKTWRQPKGLLNTDG